MELITVLVDLDLSQLSIKKKIIDQNSKYDFINAKAQQVTHLNV